MGSKSITSSSGSSLRIIFVVLFTVMLFTVPVTAQQNPGYQDSDLSEGDTVLTGALIVIGTLCNTAVVIGFIWIVVKALSSGRSSNTEPWVLKIFQIDNSGVSGAHLFIEARKPGLMAFILNALRLDDSASLKVTKGVITFRKSSLFGLVQTSTSLTQIGSFQGGYSKPITFLVLGFVSMILGFILDLAFTDWIFPLGTILGAVFALIFVIIYALQKNLMFGFETSGGAYYGLAFKRGILDGVSVDIEQVERALMMVNALIGAAALGSTYTETHDVTRYTKQGTVGAIAPAPPQTLATLPPPPPRN